MSEAYVLDKLKSFYMKIKKYRKFLIENRLISDDVRLN